MRIDTNTLFKNGSIRTMANYKGVPIADEAALTAFIERSAINYEVEKVERLNPRRGDEATGYYEIFRKDNGALLGAGMSNRYEVIQNREGFSWIPALAAGTGETLHVGGAKTFDGGKTAVLAVDLGVMHIGGFDVGDTVLKRLTFSNAHDGSGCMLMRYTPFRGRCSNGLVAAISKEAQGFRIPHTKSSRVRLAMIPRLIAEANKAMTNAEVTYNVLAQTPVTESKLFKILERLYPERGSKTGDQNAIKTRQATIELVRDADGGFIDPRTGWAAYNGITRQTNHFSPVRIHGAGNRDEARAASLLGGAIAETNRRALSILVEELEIKSEIDAILSQVEMSQAASIASMMDAPKAAQTGFSFEDILGLEVAR